MYRDRRESVIHTGLKCSTTLSLRVPCSSMMTTGRVDPHRCVMRTSGGRSEEGSPPVERVALWHGVAGRAGAGRTTLQGKLRMGPPLRTCAASGEETTYLQVHNLGARGMRAPPCFVACPNLWRSLNTSHYTLSVILIRRLQRVRSGARASATVFLPSPGSRRGVRRGRPGPPRRRRSSR